MTIDFTKQFIQIYDQLPKGTGLSNVSLYAQPACKLTYALLGYDKYMKDVVADGLNGISSPRVVLRRKVNGFNFLETLYKYVGVPFDLKTAVRLSSVETAKVFAQRLRSTSLKEFQKMIRTDTPERCKMREFLMRVKLPSGSGCAWLANRATVGEAPIMGLVMKSKGVLKGGVELSKVLKKLKCGLK